MTLRSPAWLVLAGAAAVLAYTLLSTWLMVVAPERAWTVAALFGPLIGGLALEGARRRHLPTLALCGLLAAGIAAVVVRGGVADVSRLYVAQHAVLHAVMAWIFGLSLRPGATPLITAMAQTVHANFTPAMCTYTRGLTAAWVLYFVLMIAVSLLLYALAPWAWWAFFCTVITPLAALAFFAGEPVWRYWRHPEFERASLKQMWSAWGTVKSGATAVTRSAVTQPLEQR